MAMLNWVSRLLLLGGIYGRPVVLTNAMHYYVTAIVLPTRVMRTGAPSSVWCVFILATLLAGVYGWLLFRGPFKRDFEIQRRS